jgi:hypothetical protein
MAANTNKKHQREMKRKEQPVYTGFLAYFPNAVKYVSHVSLKCNEQHHPDKPLHWDKKKSTDDPDAMLRHLIDHIENPVDDDGLYHLGKVAWRAMANLERFLSDNSTTDKKPSEWAVGKQVKIHSHIHWHEFKIGQVVEIVKQPKSNGLGLPWRCSDGDKTWWIGEDEATLCDPNSED